MDSLKKSIVIYLILVLAIFGGIYETYSKIARPAEIIRLNSADFLQPPLAAGLFPWSVRSIDTQVISKHWPNVTRAAISEQMDLVAALGVNYIAVDTPYDKVDEMRMWAEEIHKRKIHVWFRAHWDEWEGDDGRPATMTPEDYLSRTEIFITNNPGLFASGDAFTAAVEPENAGVGLGKRFLTWDHYRSFMLAQVAISNRAFAKIKLKGKIHTNWLSVNGWVVENQFTQDLVDKLGLITVDHFVSQSKTIGDFSSETNLASLTVSDFDRFYSRWHKPILLGEWGYQIFQPVPDSQQASVMDEMLRQLRTRRYLVGINYWVHMGNSAALIGDQYGSNLKYRPAASILKSYYSPLGL